METSTNRAIDTRSRIINVAAKEIYRLGFQSASIGEIIQKAKVSKGCFYHHFEAKQNLGYAVIDEVFTRMAGEIWRPVLKSENPLQAIIRLFEQIDSRVDCERMKLGCPINNLAQEMSPIDEGFRVRVENVYRAWEKELTKALQRAQNSKKMSSEVDAWEIATLIMAVSQGATGIVKNAQQPKQFRKFTRGLVRYLKSLQISK